MKYLLSILFFLFISLKFNAQVVRCATDSIHAANMQNAEFAAQYQQKVLAVQGYLDHVESDQNRADCDNILLIPVAVHFQGMGAGFDMACATSMAVDQINILNNDYAGTNSDISNWNALNPTIWPNINNGESCIQFCLATLNHPAGFSLTDGEDAVTINQTSGDFNASWAGYINFYVRSIGGGVLGYSPLGGNGNGDGVTCEVTAFSSVSCGGNTVNAPFDLGRTVSHELGHYFLLNHPWDGMGSGCSSSDGVADTPVSGVPTFGCPPNTTITCVEPILWPTYMEYCDDQCLFMFSQGQVDRMETYINSNLSGLLNSTASTCIEALCTDFEVASSFTSESCAGNDGAIVLAATGGTEPYLYSINGGTSTSNQGNFNFLSAGTYQIEVTDSSGCLHNETIVLEQLPAAVNLVNIQNTFCGSDSGSVEVSIADAGVFQYSIDGEVSFQDSPIFEDLSAGVYEIVAQSGNCAGSLGFEIEDIIDFTVDIISLKPVNCPLFNNGSISLKPSGGQPEFSYVLDNFIPSNNGFFGDLIAGKHIVNITDARGCNIELDFEVNKNFAVIGEDCPCTIFTPNAITANVDGLNDLFGVIPTCPVANFQLKIYDRWGKKVFETYDYKEKWNGGSNNYYVPNGIYNYTLIYQWGEAFDVSVEVKTESGIVHVLR